MRLKEAVEDLHISTDSLWHSIYAHYSKGTFKAWSWAGALYNDAPVEVEDDWDDAY